MNVLKYTIKFYSSDCKRGRMRLEQMQIKVITDTNLIIIVEISINEICVNEGWQFGTLLVGYDDDNGNDYDVYSSYMPAFSLRGG